MLCVLFYPFFYILLLIIQIKKGCLLRAGRENNHIINQPYISILIAVSILISRLTSTAFNNKYHAELKSLILHQKKIVCGLLNPLSYYQIYYFISTFLIFLKILIHFFGSALFINELR